MHFLLSAKSIIVGFHHGIVLLLLTIQHNCQIFNAFIPSKEVGEPSQLLDLCNFQECVIILCRNFRMLGEGKCWQHTTLKKTINPDSIAYKYLVNFSEISSYHSENGYNCCTHFFKQFMLWNVWMNGQFNIHRKHPTIM